MDAIMNKEWRHIAPHAYDFYEDQVEEAIEEIEAMKEGEKRVSKAISLESYIKFIKWLFTPCSRWDSPKEETLAFPRQVSFRQWGTYIDGETDEWGRSHKMSKIDLVDMILTFENARPNRDAKGNPMKSPKYQSVALTAANWVKIRSGDYPSRAEDKPAPRKPQSRGQGWLNQ